MNVGVKIGAGLVGAVVVFVAGYRYAAALYGKDIAALREDYAARAAALQEEYRAREKISTDSLRRAWEERDAAYADADARGAQFDDALRGLRHENDELRRRLSGAGEGACSSCRASLAECSRLLDEGAALLAEGARVRLKDAADIDAVRRVTGG
jgi:hypothetical protein